jgi:hypothetical protein
MANEGNVPDIYCDQFTVALSPYGVALTFSLTSNAPHPAQLQAGQPQVVVRMSLEHLKNMVMTLRKGLKQYELEYLGDTIKIPRAVLQQQNLTEEEW